MKKVKLQQKQTQLILYPQYVLKKPRRIPFGESFEKDPNITYSREYGKHVNLHHHENY